MHMCGRVSVCALGWCGFLRLIAFCMWTKRLQFGLIWPKHFFSLAVNYQGLLQIFKWILWLNCCNNWIWCDLNYPIVVLVVHRIALRLASSILILTGFLLPAEEKHHSGMMLQVPCFTTGIVCLEWCEVKKFRFEYISREHHLHVHCVPYMACCKLETWLVVALSAFFLCCLTRFVKCMTNNFHETDLSHWSLQIL